MPPNIELIRNEMNLLELSEQEIIRRNSLNELRAMGIEPYPAAEYVTNAFSTDTPHGIHSRTYDESPHYGQSIFH